MILTNTPEFPAFQVKKTKPAHSYSLYSFDFAVSLLTESRGLLKFPDDCLIETSKEFIFE